MANWLQPVASTTASSCGMRPAARHSAASKAWATATMDGLAQLWDVALVLKTGIEERRAAQLPKGDERATFQGHRGFVTVVAFTPNDKILVSGSHDKTARLWEVATGKQLAVLEGHKGAIVTLGLSPDGKILATGSYDQTVKLWD